jgi:hypothetical protein
MRIVNPRMAWLTMVVLAPFVWIFSLPACLPACLIDRCLLVWREIN